VFPQVYPVRLTHRPTAFNHPDWLFELKYDGFRALAYVREGEARLVSRNGNAFGSFGDLCAALPNQTFARDAIFDGEIVCLDRYGRPDFQSLFYRRGTAYFYAFDALWLDGRDLRDAPLLHRKLYLRNAVQHSATSRLRYLDHVAGKGAALFEQACELDLEGIVAKSAESLYRDDAGWLKIKNRRYTQMKGREEMFKHERPSPWAACSLLCAELH
jgi:bifunctional non-homologous end joining protein LigD